ncbi:hypothetical protein PHLH6_53690 [Pseudomonas sp. Seg1]|nr:hypothetical protein PHLH6_53690 [Pseudomonas sp. Seg1]
MGREAALKPAIAIYLDIAVAGWGLLRSPSGINPLTTGSLFAAE